MKRQVSPIATAIVLILVIAVVLGLYTKGLLGRKTTEADGGGGGGGGEGPPPLTGLPTVTVTTLAGYLRPGLADAKGWDAKFNGPSGIAAAPDGTLYVADSRNHRIRRLTPDGTVTTVAGSGPADCMPGSFADGPAARARLFNPTGIAVASDGTLYFADTGNHRIRALRDGLVSTVAGGATEADELGFERGGYVDGPAAEARFCFPADLVLTPSGELLVADLGNSTVRRLAPDGTVSTVNGYRGFRGPTGLTLSTLAEVVVADPEAGKLLEGEDFPALSARQRSGAVPQRPTGVCPMGAGVLAVADAEWHAVYAMTRQVSVLLAGVLPPAPMGGYKDSTGDEARFSQPCAIAHANNALYVADFGNNCIRALTVPPDWASPREQPDERDRRRREWRRRRSQREGDGAANRGQRPDEDLRRWRPGAQTD